MLDHDDSFLCRSVSICPISEDLGVHPLKHSLRVLGRQVDVATHDVGLPTADGLQLLLRGALSGKILAGRRPFMPRKPVARDLTASTPGAA